MKNEQATLGNRAEQMEERINDSENWNIEMPQVEEERKLRIKIKWKCSMRIIWLH